MHSADSFMKNTLLLGHRGAKGEAPENTLAGFAYAKNLDIEGHQLDGMEFDVQLTKDAGLVVFHDNTLKRCCGERATLVGKTTSELHKIKQQILAEQTYPTGEKKEDGTEVRKTFPVQFISRLSDVLHHLCDYRYIELEVKTHGQTDYEKLTDALVRELDDVSLPIYLTSFDRKILERLQGTELKNDRGLLLDKYDNEITDACTIIKEAKRLGCVGVALNKAMVTPELIQRIHDAELTTTAWTVNDVEMYQQFKDWGIGAVITDFPRLLLTSDAELTLAEKPDIDNLAPI